MLQLVLVQRESFVEEKESWRFGSLAATIKVIQNMIFILIATHKSANNNSICRNLPIASPSTTTCEFETGLNIT